MQSASNAKATQGYLKKALTTEISQPLEVSQFVTDFTDYIFLTLFSNEIEAPWENTLFKTVDWFSIWRSLPHSEKKPRELIVFKISTIFFLAWFS